MNSFYNRNPLYESGVSLLISHSLIWVFTMMCLLGTNNARDGAASTSSMLLYMFFDLMKYLFSMSTM